MKSKNRPVNRRGFLKGAVAGAAATFATKIPSTQAQQPPPQLPAALPPTEAQLAAEGGAQQQRARVVGRPGSGYMVDVIRALGIEYVATNPGSSFDGIHESIIYQGSVAAHNAIDAEVMIVQEAANQRNRGVDKAYSGTTLRDPFIDYAKMAQAYGMYGEGPISDPKDLAPALKRRIERVKRGEPALIDVLTQPR